MSTDDLQDCHPILNLTFARHRSNKFAAMAESNAASTAGLWQVLGGYDLLSVDSLASLDDILGVRADDAHSSAQNGVVLVPFDDFESNFLGADTSGKCASMRANYVRFLRDVCTNRENQEGSAQQPPFLYVAQFTLSPASHDLPASDGHFPILGMLAETRKRLIELYEDYVGHVNGQQEVKDRGWSLLPADNLWFFRSLAASDVAVVALPTTPHQLFGLVQFATIARQLCLSRISQSNGQNHPGHAFAHVEETVAFKGTLDFNEDWLLQESNWNVRLVTDAMVDSGHEKAVRDHLASVREDNVHAVAGVHTLRITFEGLSSFVKNWAPLVEATSFRVESLIDSSTSLLITPPKSVLKNLAGTTTDAKRAWRIAEDFENELTSIEERIRQWCSTFLLPEQARELNGLVSLFRNSFSRLETATATRDLLPFMRQLAACCSLHSEWKAYVDDAMLDADETDTLRTDVVRLISHLGRALQNRLESRSHNADPALYRTLEHGVSKVVAAYTTVYWVNSEVLSGRINRVDDRQACEALHTGVCLAIGSSGKVNFHEIFDGFRHRILESRGHSCISDVISAGQTAETRRQSWSAPLILLDASGHLLLQPELHMFHSLHETSLFSDWIMKPHYMQLREIFNRDCTRYFMKTLGNTPVAQSEQVQNALHRIAGEILRCVCLELFEVTNARDVSERLRSIDPRDALAALYEAFDDLSLGEVVRQAANIARDNDQNCNPRIGASSYDKAEQLLCCVKRRTVRNGGEMAQRTKNELLADTVRTVLIVRYLQDNVLQSSPTTAIEGVIRSLWAGTLKSSSQSADGDITSNREDAMQLRQRRDCSMAVLQRICNISTEVDTSLPWHLHDTLVKLLRGKGSQAYLASLRLNPELFTQPEKMVWNQCADVMVRRASSESQHCPEQSLLLTLRRINLLFALWAKSCRIGDTKVYAQVD